MQRTHKIRLYPNNRQSTYFARCCGCARTDSEQRTVALFSHGGSSAAAMGHILNLTFPYACALFHLEFTGITVIRLARKPGAQTLPCLELCNDGRHIRGECYHRLADL